MNHVDLQLAQRVFVVVGGTGLIGSAVVARLEQEGAVAVAASRSGSGANAIVLDAGDEAGVRSALEAVARRHGRLDGVVMTAAPSAGSVSGGTSSDADRVRDAIDEKALNFLRVANAALPIMHGAGFGRLVGVSGQNAFMSHNLALGLRNATLNLAAKSLADSYAGSGVTVNVINPGHVVRHPAPMSSTGAGDSTPENSADLIAFLLSPLASAISGESIAIGHRMRGAAHL